MMIWILAIGFVGIFATAAVADGVQEDMIFNENYILANTDLLVHIDIKDIDQESKKELLKTFEGFRKGELSGSRWNYMLTILREKNGKYMADCNSWFNKYDRNLNVKFSGRIHRSLGRYRDYKYPIISDLKEKIEFDSGCRKVFYSSGPTEFAISIVKEAEEKFGQFLTIISTFDWTANRKVEIIFGRTIGNRSTIYMETTWCSKKRVAEIEIRGKWPQEVKEKIKHLIDQK
ncbi:MAG: hypothetical protein ABIC04_02210 [Nanoarchaeota archaeon]